MKKHHYNNLKKELEKFIIATVDEKFKNHNKWEYKDVESLLRFYTLIEMRIKNINLEIDMVNNSIEIKKNKGENLGIEYSKKYISELERKENKLELLKEEKIKLEYLKNKIDNALESIKNDKFYKIIELYYFENNTLEYIADTLDYTLITIKRNKSRLISILKQILF